MIRNFKRIHKTYSLFWWGLILIPFLMCYLIFIEVHFPLLQVIDERIDLSASLHGEIVWDRFKLLVSVDNKLLNRLVFINHLYVIAIIAICSYIFLISIVSKGNRKQAFQNKIFVGYLFLIVICIPLIVTEGINEIHEKIFQFQAYFSYYKENSNAKELKEGLYSYINYTIRAFPLVVLPSYALCIVVFIIGLSFKIEK